MWPYTPVMSPRRSSSSASATASAAQAGPSTSKSPPASPSLTRVPSTYPADSYDPRTPRRRSVALERVDESPPVPLATRNLATSPRSMTSDSEDDTTRQGREERMDSIDQDHEQEAPLPPHLVPPASVHDTYLARYIEPVVPTNTSRPQAPRSTSVPAIAQTKPPPGLLPAADLQSADASGPSRKGSEGKPIFEIFNAEPGQGSEGLVKALKGHLADVLRVQEDIGRMHLGLEGLDADGDSLVKREKGVEELMERLGTLSETLRTYHELGTPRLHFPSDHRNGHDTQGGEHEEAAEPDPSTALPNQPPHMTRLHSAHPDLGAPSTLQTLHTSPPAAAGSGAAHKPSPLSQSQLQHKGVKDLKREVAGGSGGQERKGSTNSNLSPLRLSTDDYTAPAHPLRKKPSASFWDLEALKREREQREDQLYEHAHAPIDSRYGGGGASISTSPKRSTSQRRRYDSPIEMVDRSRPW